MFIITTDKVGIRMTIYSSVFSFIAEYKFNSSIKFERKKTLRFCAIYLPNSVRVNLVRWFCVDYRVAGQKKLLVLLTSGLRCWGGGYLWK